MLCAHWAVYWLLVKCLLYLVINVAPLSDEFTGCVNIVGVYVWSKVLHTADIGTKSYFCGTLRYKPCVIRTDGWSSSSIIVSQRKKIENRTDYAGMVYPILFITNTIEHWPILLPIRRFLNLGLWNVNLCKLAKAYRIFNTLNYIREIRKYMKSG